MPFKDPAKSREYHRLYMQKWYKRNAKVQVQRNRARRQKIWEWFAEFKASLACVRCGESHPACLEFHHDDPSKKETTINAALWQQHWGKARILAEAAKCTVLCSNCHRKHHWTDNSGGRI